MKTPPLLRLSAAWLAVAALLAIAPTKVKAENLQEEDSAQSVEEPTTDRAPKAEFQQELVVTASHPELSVQTIYSGREIEQTGGEDLGYFLRGEAGVDSIRRGPIGLDPQVRGLQETQIGVFVDGTRTFAVGPARMDSALAHVSPRAVERMRVVKGPYALTWGAGTLAAIRLDTFRPPFGGDELRLDGRVGLAYGDNASTTDGYGCVWGSNDKLRFEALLQRRSGDDWQDGNGATVPGDYRSGDARWGFGYRLGERGLLEYSGGYQEQKDIDYPGRLLDADYFYTRSHALELEWAPGGPSLESIDAEVYSNRKNHRMNNDEKPTARPMPGRIPPFGLDVVLPAESNTTGGRLRVEGGRNELTWTAGLDGYSLDQTATRSIFRRDNGVLLFRDIVWPDAVIDDVGAYVQLARHRTRSTWVATVRGDRVDARAGTASEFFLENGGRDLDQSETNLSAALSGRLRVDEAWTLTLGLGRAVRTATALERYSDRFPSTRFQVAAEFVGDPGIDPEASLQLDLGAGYQTARLFFQVEAFLRRIDDYITVEPAPDLAKRLPLSPNLVYRYVNGDEARFSGGEVQLRHRPTDRVEWRASASYVRGEDTLFDEPAFGVPPLTGRLGLRLAPRSDIWLDANLTVADRQDRVAESRLEQPTPGYSVVDLLVSYEPTASWRLLLGVDNLGDRQYVNHLNTLDPFTGQRIAEQGRNVHAAIEYSF